MNNTALHVKHLLKIALLAVVACASVSFAEEPEKTWTVNFKDSDIQEVIKFVAEVTDKTMVIDPRVKGRVKVISNRPLNEAKLMELFRSVLEVHDFTVIEVGNVVRILPLKDARSAPLPVVEAKPERGDEVGYITQVIQLKNIAAAKVLPVLRPLVPQHSHLAAYDPSNAIVVSDTVENIERLREVIEQIDTAALPTTEVVQLKYADAQDLVATLTKLDAADKQNSNSNLNLVADTRNNAVLITGEDIQRARIRSLIRRLDRSQPQTGNVRVVYLEYAKAKDVADVLTKVVQNMAKLAPGEKNKEGGATVVADEDTNALLLTGQGDVLNSLLSVVERLDIRRAQVLVEAIIVELNVSDGQSLGVEWLFANTKDGNFGSSSRGPNTRLGAVTGVLDLEESGTSDDSDDNGIIDLATGLAGLTGQAFGVAGTSGDQNFLALLTALKSSSQANILSTPSVLTMDNSEATISVGQNVPFVTGSFTSTGGGSNPANPFQTIQREDVGVSLTVTPQVNEGNNVVLNIAQEVSSIAGSVAGSADLITNQSTINTQILAKDGEIIVLGGLMKEDVQDNQEKVPFLGSIPILGNLFKYQSSSVIKSNLMVFLRAKIVRDNETIADETADKYRIIRDLQVRQQEQGLPLLSDSYVPVLPEFTVKKLPDTEPSSVKSSAEPEATKDDAQ